MIASRDDSKSARIDWALVREQLAEGERALREATDASPEKLRRLLEERARVLAQVKASSRGSQGDVLCLVCTARGGRYALTMRDMQGISVLRRCQKVPLAPREVLGVVNLHGEIWTVLDLATLMGNATPLASLDAESANDEPAASRYLIRLEVAGVGVAICVDAIGDMIQVDMGALHTRQEESEHLERGITPDMVVVVDTAGLLKKHGHAPRDERSNLTA